jgi:hypothetical protein
MHLDDSTIQYEGSIERINVPLGSVCRPGHDGEFANGLSGLGGGASTSSRLSRRRKRANKASRSTTGPSTTFRKIFVKPANGAIIPVASRTTLVFNSSLLMDGARVPQDLEVIGLLEALEDEVARDLYVCAILKFLRDLYLATPCDVGMTKMLGRLEPICQGEQVMELVASLEEHTERQAIYTNHIEAQAALVAATAAGSSGA